MVPNIGPIGIFDSGFGGLSIFREIHRLMPDYDYIFLGDNGRAPYGDRDFDEVYSFTAQAVRRLFSMGCPIIILACNTASARALRTIQVNDLPRLGDPTRRVLGVIRPTIERCADLSYSKHIGLLGTRATVSSGSYPMELAKTHPDVVLSGHICHRWVPMIERGLQATRQLHDIVCEDLEYLLARDPEIDTLILGCTHFPLITSLIQTVLQELDHPEIILMPQGKPVSYSLRDYFRRHPEMEQRIGRNAHTRFLTSGSLANFEPLASLFLGKDAHVHAERIAW